MDVEELFERFHRRAEGFGELRRRMEAISVTAVSPRREVSVTVDHAGMVTDLKFPTGVHRKLAPAELSDLILRTIEDAVGQARHQVSEIVAPVLPDGMRVGDVAKGAVTTEQLARPRLPDSVWKQLGIGTVPS